MELVTPQAFLHNWGSLPPPLAIKIVTSLRGKYPLFSTITFHRQTGLSVSFHELNSGLPKKIQTTKYST